MNKLISSALIALFAAATTALAAEQAGKPKPEPQMTKPVQQTEQTKQSTKQANAITKKHVATLKKTAPAAAPSPKSNE